MLSKVQADVESGKSFGDALSSHPEVFSDIFVKMVAAGEVSGTLDTTLERLAMQQEKDRRSLYFLPQCFVLLPCSLLSRRR